MKLKTLKALPSPPTKPKGPHAITRAVLAEADRTGDWVEFPKTYTASRSASSHYADRHTEYEFAARGDRVYCRRKPGAK